MITKFRHMKVCKNCYQSFFSVRSDKMYCNSACRQEAYRGRVEKKRSEELRYIGELEAKRQAHRLGFDLAGL